MNSLKKGEPLPLLNFEGGPGILLLNFEGGPGVPLLNFRGVSGPTFKLWGESRVPGPRVPRARVLGSWSHFYTMPTFRVSFYLLDNQFWSYNLQVSINFYGHILK